MLSLSHIGTPRGRTSPFAQQRQSLAPANPSKVVAPSCWPPTPATMVNHGSPTGGILNRLRLTTSRSRIISNKATLSGEGTETYARYQPSITSARARDPVVDDNGAPIPCLTHQRRGVDGSRPGRPSVRFPEVTRGERMTQMGRKRLLRTGLNKTGGRPGSPEAPSARAGRSYWRVGWLGV
jgi:hypothetical protein